MMVWWAFFVCLVVSFVFSGVEAGIFSVNRVSLRHRVKMGDAAAVKLDRLLQQPDRLLVTVLMLTNLMNIFALAVLTEQLSAVFGRAGYVLTIAVAAPLYLFGLELLPKALFRRFPYRALATLAQPLWIVDRLLGPVHWVGGAISRWVAQGGADEEHKLFAGREEFKYLTFESERTGALGRDERQMIHNVVDFRTVTARDVMRPMGEVPTIACDASIGELLSRGRSQRVECWPVISEMGEVAGLVTLSEVALSGRERGRVESFQRRMVKVAPDEFAPSVLRKMRAARTTMAAVVGPGAKPLGVVTWEGLIQRLVAYASSPGKSGKHA
jgi:putative hemolysin